MDIYMQAVTINSRMRKKVYFSPLATWCFLSFNSWNMIKRSTTSTCAPLSIARLWQLGNCALMSIHLLTSWTASQRFYNNPGHKVIPTRADPTFLYSQELNKNGNQVVVLITIPHNSQVMPRHARQQLCTRSPVIDRFFVSILRMTRLFSFFLYA